MNPGTSEPQREATRGSLVLGAVIAIVAVACALVALATLGGDPSTSADTADGARLRDARNTDQSAPESDGDPRTSTEATETPAQDDPTGTGASGGSNWPSELESLVVEPEGSPEGYDRNLFKHWIDADGNGCDTRCEVLGRQRLDSLPGLPDGGWMSIYDGYSTDDPSELDVDHVVALSEAWVSGASGWDDPRREAFANDLDSGQLVAVTAATNRSKSDRDPAEWQPPNRSAWCEWGAAWIGAKAKWALSADRAEVDALTNIMRGCP